MLCNQTNKTHFKYTFITKDYLFIASLFRYNFFPVATLITSLSGSVPIRDALRIGKIIHDNQITAPGDSNGGKNNKEVKS
jgi:hypothetical protein